jgi:hypothetical protein
MPRVYARRAAIRSLRPVPPDESGGACDLSGQRRCGSELERPGRDPALAAFRGRVPFRQPAEDLDDQSPAHDRVRRPADGRPGVHADPARAESRCERPPRLPGGLRLHERKGPHPGEVARSAPFHERPAVAQHERRGEVHAAHRGGRGPSGVAIHGSERQGRAFLRDRAFRTARPARRADELTQVHPRRENVSRTRAWKQLAGPIEDRPLPRRAVSADREHAGEDPGDVGVGCRNGSIEREACDRGGHVPAEPGQIGQGLRLRRNPPAVLGGDAERGAPEIARAGVITQPRPGGEHRVLSRSGERGHVRKPLQKRLVTRGDRAHGRLLQHHLRDPDPVGVAGVTPRKEPLLASKPGQELSADAGSPDVGRKSSSRGGVRLPSDGPGDHRTGGITA